MDIERFKNNFQSNRMRNIIDFSYKKQDWFSYNELFEHITNEAKNYYISIGKEDSNGKPSETQKQLRYLIKIGFFEINPQKGIRINKDFTPVDQRPLLKDI